MSVEEVGPLDWMMVMMGNSTYKSNISGFGIFIIFGSWKH